MLDGIGFRRWNNVHIVDLRDPALLDARMGILEQWWPESDSNER